MNTSALIGVVVAGGASSRMPADKAEMRMGGQTMLQRAARMLGMVCGKVVVVGRPRPDWWPADSDAVAFLPDRLPEGIVAEEGGPVGPAAGVYTALSELNAAILVLPVDMPGVPMELLEALAGRHVKNPTAPLIMACWKDESGTRQVEPLVAVYTPAILPALVEKLKSGKRGLWTLSENPRALFWNVPPEQAPMLANLNDPEEWRKYLEANP